ncbi:MAG TPA: rRNA maturation RNase YbeY [Gemmatimonadaceae bacterium]|nr:rRNA maturation RNase YbeY [Gemmatimonadaceae bacterium]
MSLDVEVAADGVRVPLAKQRVADLARAVLEAEGVRDASISFAFVRPSTIATVNREHLGHKGPTDVISFPLAPAAGAPLGGDVYICPDVAARNAVEHGVGLREEIARLVVHATLHVLGHEHPEGEGREMSAMWRRQEELLSSFEELWRA